jgi:serine/threonine protein kinase
MFTVGTMLGKGGFGTVYAGFRNSDHLPVAIKSVSKNCQLMSLPQDAKSNQQHFVPVEVALMKQVTHVPGVIHLIDCFELPDCFMIIMEWIMSGLCRDLFDIISDSGPIREDLAKHIFRQIVNTVIQVHAAGVLHCDIKDENILIDTRTYKVKLIDFGSGSTLQNKVYTDFGGTRVYAPPEWIKFRRYRADGLTVWSLGILLYNMVCGNIPFETDSQIQKAHLYFSEILNLSKELKDLIRLCLMVSPEGRITLAQLAEHFWLKASPKSV